MTDASPSPAAPDGPRPVGATRLPRTLALSAARRLVVGSGEERERAARKLVEHAAAFGIDLSLAFGVVREDASGVPAVAQACLAVPGSGRTVMLFVSAPGEDRWLGDAARQRDERAQAVRAAMAWAEHQPDERFRLVQALPDPTEIEALAAYERAGLRRIAELEYLSRPLPAPALPEPQWPADVSVEPGLDPARNAAHRAAALEALEASYEGTLDCPELFGLRRTEDVLESHLAAGEFSPADWVLVRRAGKPEGVCLLNRIRTARGFELVYLGLSPGLRGRGLGRSVLGWAMGRLRVRGEEALRCAVDARNAPARGLYASMGFVPEARRVAMVAALHGGAAGASGR